MTNPVEEKSSSAHKTNEPKKETTFEALGKLLSFPTNDQEQWWQWTGSLLGRMLESAQYPLEQQYQYLAFFDNHVAPGLGPYPPRFRSSVTVSGQPIELSVNYQQYGATHPIVRIGFEALDSHSGTDRDPFNQLPVSVVLNSLSRIGLRDFDPHLFSYFWYRHSVNVKEKARLQRPLASRVLLKSQHGFGVDLKNGNVLVKGYTFPGLKTIASGQSMRELMTQSIAQLQPESEVTFLKAWAMVDSYLTETNGYNDFHLFSWDYVDLSKSRLKFYTVSLDLTWPKVEEVWTLNKRTANYPANIQGLEYLRQLWDLIRPGDSERELLEDRPGHVKQNEIALLWNYEMTSDDPVPSTKLYLSLHGINDLTSVKNLASFFGAVGWKGLAATYLDTVNGYFSKYDLAKTSHLVMWVSFAYSEKTGVYLSIYYHSSGDLDSLRLVSGGRSQ